MKRSAPTTSADVSFSGGSGSAPSAGRAGISRAGSIQRLDRRHEDVAGPALGDDELRARRIDLDLAAQAHDLHVDRAVVHLRVVQPREVQELVARQHALRGAAERGEQAELAVAELELAALG